MKNFMYVILGFIGIVWILGIWTVDANATITHYTDSNISYTLNSWFATEKLFTWVWTIVISDCESGQTEDCTTITILDRNLWATVAGTGWMDSYWYHFQWWNNYWFKPCTSEKWREYMNYTNSSGKYIYTIYKPNILCKPYMKNKLAKRCK